MNCSQQENSRKLQERKCLFSRHSANFSKSLSTAGKNKGKLLREGGSVLSPLFSGISGPDIPGYLRISPETSGSGGREGPPRWSATELTRRIAGECLMSHFTTFARCGCFCGLCHCLRSRTERNTSPARNTARGPGNGRRGKALFLLACGSPAEPW